MDDIYFSDKRGRRNDNSERSSSADRFTESEYYEAPAYEPESSADKTNFKVSIPENKYSYSTQQNRTPQGRRRADIPSPPQARTPSGAPRQAVPRAVRNPETNSEQRQPQTPPVAPRKKKKNKIGGKIAVAVILLMLVACIGVFAYGYSLLGEIAYDDTITENAYVDPSSLYSSSSVTNILIIGSDARDYDGTEGQRSDSMILFSIDKLHKQIKLTSFLRDSYVYIPEADYDDKLNASFSYGGPQLTMDTIEYNFGVDIDHYVIINFNLFTQLIDLLGGITIEDITEDEVEYMVNTLSFDGVTVGTNQLNGYRALWYCRMRALDNDFYRTERQRKVIKSVIKKVASTDLATLTDIVKQVVPNISTDIPQSELLSLGVGAALSFLRYDIVQQQIPAADTWKYGEDENGASVIFVNLEANKHVLKTFVYEKYNESQAIEIPESIEEEYYGEYYDYYYEDEDYYYDDDYYYEYY